MMNDATKSTTKATPVSGARRSSVLLGMEVLPLGRRGRATLSCPPDRSSKRPQPGVRGEFQHQPQVLLAPSVVTRAGTRVGAAGMHHPLGHARWCLAAIEDR